MRRIFTLTVTLLLVSGLGVVFAQDAETAPDFTLENLNGDDVRLSDVLADGPVLLDFWATWCRPCKKALPKFAAIYEDYKDQGFTLLAISVDDTRSMSKVKPYILGNNWEFPVLYDTNSEVLKQYRGRTVPHAVLVDSDGSIIQTWIGYHPGEEDEIRAKLAALLAD